MAASSRCDVHGSSGSGSRTPQPSRSLASLGMGTIRPRGEHGGPLVAAWRRRPRWRGYVAIRGTAAGTGGRVLESGQLGPPAPRAAGTRSPFRRRRVILAAAGDTLRAGRRGSDARTAADVERRHPKDLSGRISSNDPWIPGRVIAAVSGASAARVERVTFAADRSSGSALPAPGTGARRDRLGRGVRRGLARHGASVAGVMASLRAVQQQHRRVDLARAARLRGDQQFGARLEHVAARVRRSRSRAAIPLDRRRERWRTAGRGMSAAVLGERRVVRPRRGRWRTAAAAGPGRRARSRAACRSRTSAPGRRRRRKVRRLDLGDRMRRAPCPWVTTCCGVRAWCRGRGRRRGSCPSAGAGRSGAACRRPGRRDRWRSPFGSRLPPYPSRSIDQGGLALPRPAGLA